MTTLHALGQELRLLDAGPPSEVPLFPFGEIRTLKGAFQFTRRSAELVARQWAQLNRQFGFDYGHDEFNPGVPSKDKIAAGWGDLELRTDGVWCARVIWSPEAARKIAARELRYTSPAFTASKAGEITALHNCALTNSPATLGARPLVLSAAGHLLSMPNPKLMLRAFGALLAAAQAAADSDSPALKEIGVKLAADLPPHIARLKEAFPDAEDGEDAEEATQKELAEVYEAATKLTGATEGVVGALHALKAQADQKVKALGASDELIKAAFVDRLIRETRQVHPQDRAAFVLLSMKDLQAYAKSAPRIGPPGGSEVQGAVTLSGKPAEAEAESGEAGEVVLQVMNFVVKE